MTHYYPGSVASSNDDQEAGGVPINNIPPVRAQYHPVKNIPPVRAKYHPVNNNAMFSQAPRRQPKGPPANLDDLVANGFKKDQPTHGDAFELAGFARFIKDHVSPPHTRVTAGGRVVPVGPKSPPPTFHMGFIDRLLQAAEEAKQDPTKKDKTHTLSWLDNSELNDADVSEEVTEASQDSDVPSVATKHTASAICRHEKRRGTLEIPETFQVLADMADGSKIVILGKAWFRAFLTKEGTTAFETLTTAADKKSSVVEDNTPVHGQHVVPDPDMPEGMMTLNGGEPFMLIQGGGPTGGWISAAPYADEGGNLQFAQRGSTVYNPPCVQTRPIMPTPDMTGYNGRIVTPMGRAPHALPHHGHVPTSNQAYNGRGGIPVDHNPHAHLHHGNAPTSTPGNAQPTKKTPALPLEFHDMLPNELVFGLESTTAFLNLKRSRLDSIERWLAKELEYLSSQEKTGLIVEKGELIRACDFARKDKEKYEYALRDVHGYTLQRGKWVPPSSITQPQQHALHASHTSHGPPVSYPQVPDAINAHGPPPITSHVNNTMYQHPPPPGFDHPQREPSMLQMLANKSLKADAPNFVPAMLSQREMGNSKTTLHNAESVMAMGGKSEHSTSKLALVQVSGSDNSETSSGGPHPVVNGKPASRVSTKVTLRHPDGTPVDLAAIQNQIRRNANKAQLADQPSSHNTYQASEPRDKNAAAVSASSKSYSPPASVPTEEVKYTWRKKDEESKEEFELRCREQRRNPQPSSMSNNVPVSNASAAAAITSLPNGIYTNENLQFLNAPMHNMVTKAQATVSFPVHRSSTSHLAPHRMQQQAMSYGVPRANPSNLRHYQSVTVPANYRRDAQSTISQMDMNAPHRAQNHVQHVQHSYPQGGHMVAYPSSDNPANVCYLPQAPLNALPFPQYRSPHGR